MNWLESKSQLQESVYVITPVETSKSFEKQYLQVRQAEGRLLNDEEVKSLPWLNNDHPHCREWQLRNRSFKRLYDHLHQFTNLWVLDVGCGNGWLGNRLSDISGLRYFGADLNFYELQQASRLFSAPNLTFLFLDLFQTHLPRQAFDFILLNGTIQYFKGLPGLLEKLMPALKKDGQIHILDSPVYDSREAAANATERTKTYYQQLGYPEMADHYFHHTWEALKGFNYQIKYNPKALTSRIKRKWLISDVPFPWIVVKNNSSRKAAKLTKFFDIHW